MRVLFLSLIFILCCVFNVVNAQSTEATYRIAFTSNWSQDTHPHSSGSLPANAHWSKLVGATHSNDIRFLMMGTTASPGVERIAELGSNGVFFQEVNDAIARGRADQIISGPSLGTAGGEMIIDELVMHSDFPLLSLASMIAPSPDWMIALNGLNMLDSEGDWLSEITMDLFPYDSGTDNGIDYLSPNSDTDPAQPISSLRGVIPFSLEKIGTLNIERLDVQVGTTEIDESFDIELNPNPTSGQMTISSDTPIVDYRIYDLAGSLVQEQVGLNSTYYAIDISALNQGIYLAQVKDIQGASKIIKIIKL